MCNTCPVKDACTVSHHGREVTRQLDPWPHSDSGRFHRGSALAVFNSTGKAQRASESAGVEATVVDVSVSGMAFVPASIAVALDVLLCTRRHARGRASRV